MTTLESNNDRHSAVDTIAGLLAAASIFMSAIAMGFGLILELEARPVRSAFVAILLALVAARMSARHRNLALAAVFIAMFAWVIGLTLAVITDNPLV